EPGRNGRCRIRGRHHRHHLKIHEIGPAVHPLLKERALIALHHLKAPAEIGVNPTRNVPQSLRRQPALVTETPVHGDGVTISEVFNNHVQHPYNHPSPTAEKRSNSSATCLRCWKKSSSRIFSLGTRRKSIVAAARCGSTVFDPGPVYPDSIPQIVHVGWYRLRLTSCSPETPSRN